MKDAILNASKICKENGVKLTTKRQYVLAELVQSATALSAYEIMERIRFNAKADMPAMSVYRILDFLMEYGFVHRLSTANKYVACLYFTCVHSHGTPQFLICENCNLVKELPIDDETISALNRNCSAAGFSLNNQQIEMHGLCKNCIDGTREIML
jgi:Fur family zinc uptake transcriptional regulator